MSDVMLFGVLKMPYELAMSTELSSRQFYDRVQELVARFEAEQPAIKQDLIPEQPAQQQEPVAWVCEASSSDEKHAIDYWPGDVDDLPIGTKLYTSPPARKPWVSLTDEEINELDPSEEIWGLNEVVRAAEAKLREKNA